MKVRLETVIKDPRTSRELGLVKPTAGFEADPDEIFLDGPTCRRVAVIDFEPGTGTLSPPVPFQKPTKARKIGRYKLSQSRGCPFRRRDEGQRLRHGPQDDGDVRGVGQPRPQAGRGRSTRRSSWSCPGRASGTTRSTSGTRTASSSSSSPRSATRTSRCTRPCRTTSCRTRRGTRSSTESRPTCTTPCPPRRWPFTRRSRT